MEQIFDQEVLARYFYLFGGELHFSLTLPYNVKLVNVPSIARQKLLEQKDDIAQLLDLGKSRLRPQMRLVNGYYARFFPQLMENQFEFQNNAPLSFKTADLFLRTLTYSPDDELFSYQSSFILQEWGTFKNQVIRSITGQEEVNAQRPSVVYLHDFYQHPLQLNCMVNYLRQSCNIFVPFVHDVFRINQEYRIGSLLQVVVDCIADYIDDCLGDAPFTILAQGISCQFAVLLQQMLQNCRKVVLINAIGDFRFKFVKREEQQGITARFPTQHEYCSYNTIERNTELFEAASTSKSEIPLLKNDRKPAVRYKETGCSYKSYQYVVAPRERLLVVKPGYVPVKKHGPLFADFTPGSKLKTPYPELFQVLDAQNLVLSQDQKQQLFQLYNTILEDIYDEDSQRLLGSVFVSDTGKLNLGQQTAQSSGFSFRKLDQQQFFQLLPALCVFSSFFALAGFQLFRAEFDQQYTAITRQMFQLAQAEEIDVVDDSIVFLQSSHDCMLSLKTLDFYQQACAQARNITMRTILGAGHDLISCNLSIVAGLI